MGGGDHRPQHRVALVEVLLHAAEGVAAERLDHRVAGARGRADLRVLALREAVHHRDREPAVRLAGDLAGAEDRGVLGHPQRLALVRGRHQRRRLADAPRVEELVLVLDLEAQDLAALEEEGPLLLVEGLVGGEVDDGGVGLDLAEVGVEGRVEREVRGQADLGVEAERARAVGAAVRLRGPGARLAERVGHELHVARLLQPADPVQLAQLVHAARVLARDQLPLVLFLVASDPAPGVHAPDLLVLGTEAQLVERDAELGRPALLVVRHLAVPDRVPGGVPLRLAVAEDQVDLAPARAEVELEARALVVVAVEADADHVDREPLEVVAAAWVTVHLRRIVEGADRHVDLPVVVQDLDLGLLRGLGSLDGHVLPVVA